MQTSSRTVHPQQLVAFLKELSTSDGEQPFSFKGVTITPLWEYHPHLVRKLLSLFFRITLPSPVHADLLLASRREKLNVADPIRAVFHYSTCSETALRRYLHDGLGDLLIELSSRYFFEMMDETLRFGPTRGEPEETASDLLRLIDALPRTSERRKGTQPIAAADGATYVSVRKTTRAEEALFWHTLLDSDGIHHRLDGLDEHVRWNAVTEPLLIQLLVPAVYAERAEALIRASSASDWSQSTPFCYVCGTTFAAQPSLCPECGTRLVE